MSAFIAEHGEPPTEDDFRSEAPPEAPEAPEAPDDGEDDGIGQLDPETLKELGLLPEEGQPGTPQGTQKEGAESADMDLAPFARALGVDPTELSYKDGEVMVRTKVDGEVATVPLSRLREGYQLKQHFTRQQEQFLEERRKWEEARTQSEQKFQQQAALAQEILEQEEQQLKTEYTRDWDALRREDPAEYAAAVAEYNQRLHQIRTRKQGLMEGMQRRYQEAMQQQQQQAMQEQQRLAEALKWKTQEEMAAGAQQLQRYLIEQQGFHPEQVASIMDHRALVLADKARRYDELIQRVNTTRKQVREVHPMPAGGAVPQPKGRRSIEQAKAKLAKTGSMTDAAAVFEEMGIV